MNALLTTVLSAVIGSVVMVNGVMVNTDDILAETKTVVNQANVHQIATVLELYYSDYNEYPDATGGEELISLLENENYIRNRPLDSNVFNYQRIANGQDYTLNIK